MPREESNETHYVIDEIVTKLSELLDTYSNAQYIQEQERIYDRFDFRYKGKRFTLRIEEIFEV